MAMNRIQKTCAMCGKPFSPKTVTSLYCSKECSQAAYRKKKAEQKEAEKLKAVADAVPDERPFISIPEAIAIYGVTKSTLYRLIRQGQIPAINLGTRLLRISRNDIEKMFVARQQSQTTKEKPTPKVYSLEPEDCYILEKSPKSLAYQKASFTN